MDSFLRKRIGKLLIPLIIITILFILLQTTTKGFNANYFYTRLLQGNGTTPYSWFIFAIIACYILFYNSFYKRNNLQISIIINTFLIIVLIFITYKLEWHIWTISLISFPLGLYTSLYEYHIEKLIKTHHLLLILVICAICFYCNYSLYVNKLPIWWPIFSNIFPLMTYCVLRGISISNIKLLNWIGKYSYEIYLIHGTLIYFTQDYINNPHTLSMIIILGTLLLAPIIKKIAIIIYSQ